MGKKKSTWFQDYGSLIVCTIITTTGAFGGIVYAASDDDVDCYKVRESVVKQAEVDRRTLTPFPSDSPEAEDCDINDYIDRLD